MIGVVGLGYVGLPLALAFVEAGHTVRGVDVDANRVAALNAGRSHIEDVPSERLRGLGDRFRSSTRYEDLAGVAAILICVPTPLSLNREPDLSHVIAAANALAVVLRRGQLVVLESTTYPGTTRECLLPLLEESGLKAGRDFHLAFSPERVDPGNRRWTLANTPRVVGGLTDACGECAQELYGTICERVVRVSSPEAAELSKLLENIFRSVNIALVNELAVLADRMGIDLWEVIDASATKPFGFMRFDPGPGMGGHCLPVDPFYLAWRAREFDFVPEFIELAGKVNQQMPYQCVDRVQRALSDAGKPLRGAKVVILGAAYKPGVADTRESPALKIITLLSERRAQVCYHDPHVSELKALGLRSTQLDQALAGADAVVIVTAHPEIDHVAIAREAPLMIDLRGVTREVVSSSIVRL